MSRRVVLVPTLVLGLGLAVAAGPAAAQDPFSDPTPQEPNATTQGGPATLENRFSGPVPAIQLPPAVLLGVRVAVGPGGRPGEVRVRVPDRRPGAAAGAQAVGPWTTLPAEPGVHRLPAPRVPWSRLGDDVSIDQRTGGHRMLRTSPCMPQLGRWGDVCATQRVLVHVPTPPDAGPFGVPTTELPGAALTVAAVSETDADRDLLADRTEDPQVGAQPAPTDLRVRGRVERLRSGRVRLRITVTNRGPAHTRAPRLELGAPGRTGTWSSRCAPSASEADASGGPTAGRRCVLPGLRAGRSRTVVHTLRRGARPGRLSVRAYGDRPNLRRGWGVDRIHLRVR